MDSIYCSSVIKLCLRNWTQTFSGRYLDRSPYCFEENINEDFIFRRPLTERTTGSDMLKAVTDYITSEDTCRSDHIDISSSFVRTQERLSSWSKASCSSRKLLTLHHAHRGFSVMWPSATITFWKLALWTLAYLQHYAKKCKQATNYFCCIRRWDCYQEVKFLNDCLSWKKQCAGSYGTLILYYINPFG
jgi:hypothetical protein